MEKSIPFIMLPQRFRTYRLGSVGLGGREYKARACNIHLEVVCISAICPYVSFNCIHLALVSVVLCGNQGRGGILYLG